MVNPSLYSTCNILSMQAVQASLRTRKPLHIIPELLQPEQTPATKDPLLLHSHISDFKDKIEDLIAEVYELNIEKASDEEEHRLIVEKMEQDHQRYCSEIESYKGEIEKLEVAEREEEASFLEVVEKDRKGMEIVHMAEVNALSKRIEELEGEYHEGKKLEEMEREIKARIEKLRGIYVEAQYKHHDSMNEKEKREIEETSNAHVQNEVQTKNVIKGAYSEAKDKVIKEQREAFGQKIVLKEELLGLQKELERLKKETNVASIRMKEVKINASINIESLEQYRAVGALQIARIRSFKDKAEDIKGTIALETEKRKKQIDGIKQKGQARVKQLSQRLAESRKIKTKTQKQLQNIKTLATLIVDQRFELQQFFEQAMGKLNQEADKSGRSKDSQKVYSDKVDISELDAFDKEKILRTLLTRISMGNKHDIV